MKILIKCHTDRHEQIIVRLAGDRARAKFNKLINTGNRRKAILHALKEGEILEKAAGNALPESDASLILTETSAHRCLV